MMVLNGRATFILNEIKKSAKAPAAASNAPEELIAAVAEKNGVQFASDYLIMESSLFKACSTECLKRSVFYKSYLKLISQIQIKKLWVVERNRMKDSVAFYIQDREQKQFLDNFSAKRSYISDNYDKIPSYELKELALALTQAIDGKVMELKKR
jgi:hypothetical protein